MSNLITAVVFLSGSTLLLLVVLGILTALYVAALHRLHTTDEEDPRLSEATVEELGAAMFQAIQERGACGDPDCEGCQVLFSDTEPNTTHH